MGSHPLFLQTLKDKRGRRQSCGDATVISPEQVLTQELPHMSEGLSPLSRHKRKKESKHNNKYCSFFNLCSSSIACCKQCFIFAFSLIVKTTSGLEWNPKPNTHAPTWNLLEARPTCLQALSPGCLGNDSD